MATYLVHNTTSGLDLGYFEGAGPADAIRAMLDDAGDDGAPGADLVAIPEAAARLAAYQQLAGGEHDAANWQARYEEFDAIRGIVRSHGEWAHGGNLDEVAVEWQEGFTPREVEHWLDAGVCWPDAAIYAWGQNVSPNDYLAAAKSDDDYNDGSEQYVERAVDRISAAREVTT